VFTNKCQPQQFPRLPRYSPLRSKIPRRYPGSNGKLHFHIFTSREARQGQAKLLPVPNATWTPPTLRHFRLLGRAGFSQMWVCGKYLPFPDNFSQSGGDRDATLGPAVEFSNPWLEIWGRNGAFCVDHWIRLLRLSCSVTKTSLK